MIYWLLILGGLLFWLAVSIVAAVAILLILVGVVRAVSLHKFLVLVRRAADGGYCPFKTYRYWAVGFLRDVWELAGLPGSDTNYELEFAGGKDKVDARWSGIGRWEIKPIERLPLSADPKQ